MRAGTMKAGIAGAGLFAAGWLAAQVTPSPFLVAAAAAEATEPVIEQSIHALMYGMATVAVDAEAAALRINELADRHAALERRVAQLEARSRR